MKKTTFAILFSALLIFSCIFASCQTEGGLFDDPNESIPPAETSSAQMYAAMIRDLENQIIELQQNQYISDTESRKELERLQSLLAELKEQAAADTSTSSPDRPSADSSQNSPTGNLPPADSAAFRYTVQEDQVTITEYTGDDTYLVIPSMIDGKSVTAIADSAFRSNTLKTVIIPNGVAKIGWFAFQECPALISITIPSSVESIGYSAFSSLSNKLTIYCHSNSFAQKYAQSYGLSYAII